MMKRFFWLIPFLVFFLGGCTIAPQKEYRMVTKYVVLDIDSAKLQKVAVPPPPAAKDFVPVSAATPQELVSSLENQRDQLWHLNLDLYAALKTANDRILAIAKAHAEKRQEVDRLNAESLQRAKTKD